jgi:AcrR family transcriptional regulator
MNKRDSIYETALRLFNENGFDRTPTARIAKESGVAIGTLFHYFSTKEELINSLYLKCKDSLIGKMLDGTSGEKAYRGRLKRIYSNFLHWSTEYTGEFLFFQQFSNSVHINAKTKEEGLNKFSVMLDLLREGIENEIIRKTDEGYLITVIVSLIMSNANYFIENKSILDEDEFVEESFSFIWNSIKN